VPAHRAQPAAGLGVAVARKAISFGLFAAFSIALTFYIAAQIAHFQPGVSRYSLSATFDDVMNLQSGDPVRLAGLPVGQVSGVKVVDGRADVTFEVNTSVHLPEDSEVAVRGLNLIGQRELYLYPGDSEKELTDGTHMTRTRSVLDLGALLNQLGPLTQALDPAQLNSLVEALTAAFGGNRDNLNAIVDELATVLGTLAQRKDTITQMIADYDTVATQISKRDLEIQTMVDNLAALSTAFAQSQTVLDEALVQLPQLVSGLQLLLGEDGEQLGRIIDNLSLVSGTVHDHLGDLESAVKNFEGTFHGLFEAIRYGQFVGVMGSCIAFTGPPCPYEPLLTANVGGAGRLESPGSFQSMLLGQS